MIINFFSMLVAAWLQDGTRQLACKDAFHFALWLHDLKRAAFMSAYGRQEQHRLKLVLKAIRKMPPLSEAFFNALTTAETMPGVNAHLIMERRDKVKPFLQFVCSITTNEDVLKLRLAFLVHQHPAKRL